MKAKILAIITAFLFFSCSVQYGMRSGDDEDEVPEFVFEQASMKRVQKGEVTVELKTQKIEQYTGGKNVYAQNAQFVTMAKGKTSTEGSCNLLAVDSENEEEMLFGDITLFNNERGISIKADSIKWNGKSEQLQCGETGGISIKKGNVMIKGSAFAASAVSGAFSFGGAVQGEIETDDREYAAEE